MIERVLSVTFAFLLLLGSTSAVAQEQFITVASTTSTEESGLFGYLLPLFTKETGIEVRVVAVGTGQALKIADAKSPFVARGDDSGTSKAEMRLWKEAGIDPKIVRGGWYRDTGSGMGQTLNTAAAMDGYTLSDRGTWLSFRNKQNLTIVVEGDRRLFNQYGVMLVNPAKYPHVKKDLGLKFIDWLTSATGQRAIADYKIDGAQLFFPDAQGSPS